MNDLFPKVDPLAFAVKWAPLLIEPIPHGPERFVAAIAAAADTGESLCLRRLDRSRISALFGDAGPTLAAVVDASVDSLHRHLEQGNGLEDWTPAFNGVYIGQVAVAYVTRFRDIFGMAAKVCSAVTSNSARAKSSVDWGSKVADQVKRIQPSLSNSINAQLRLGATGHVFTFTFYGVNLAANVVVLNSQRLGQSMREAKSHLWNLSLLQDAPDLLIKPQRLELLSGAREDDAKTREAIDELASEAIRRSVEVSRVESAEDAARQIVAKAA